MFSLPPPACVSQENKNILYNCLAIMVVKMFVRFTSGCDKTLFQGGPVTKDVTSPFVMINRNKGKGMKQCVCAPAHAII